MSSSVSSRPISSSTFRWDMRGSSCRSGLPAAAERTVDLDELRQFTELRLHEAQLRGEQTRFAGEHFEIAGGAALIAQIGQAPGVLRGPEEALLRLPEFAQVTVTGDRIRDFSKRTLNGLPVGEFRLLPPGVGERHLRPGAAGIEDRLDGAGADRPRPGGEQRGERRAGDAA